MNEPPIWLVGAEAAIHISALPRYLAIDSRKADIKTYSTTSMPCWRNVVLDEHGRLCDALDRLGGVLDFLNCQQQQIWGPTEIIILSGESAMIQALAKRKVCFLRLFF
jgi:hypothetical protein